MTTPVTRRAMLDRIANLLELAPGALSGEEDLEGFALWDSMSILAFTVMVREDLGFVVEGTDVKAARQVKDLIALMGDSLQQ